MEIDFREVEFQNVTIGLKNATIEPLEPGIRTYKKILQENAAIGP